MRCGPPLVNPLLAIIFEKLRSSEKRHGANSGKLVSDPINLPLPTMSHLHSPERERLTVASSCNRQMRILLGDRLIESTDDARGADLPAETLPKRGFSDETVGSLLHLRPPRHVGIRHGAAVQY
jgi:hypothetical protein